MSPAALAGLLALVANGTISGSIAKDVFDKMFASGRTADEIVAAEGLTQIDDASTIRALVDQRADHARRRRRAVPGGEDHPRSAFWSGR